MLEFDNYIIKPLETTDLEQYFRLVDRNRKRLEDFFVGTVSKTKDIQATRDFLNEIDGKRVDKRYFPYVVVEKESNSFVAFFDLKNIDWSIPKAEIGCYTDEGYAGTGFTTKALNLFIDFCFEHFQFQKIFLRTHHSNKAAIQLAEKCGFEVEGIIRRDYKTTSGEIVDLVYYGRISHGT